MRDAVHERCLRSNAGHQFLGPQRQKGARVQASRQHLALVYGPIARSYLVELSAMVTAVFDGQRCVHEVEPLANHWYA